MTLNEYERRLQIANPKLSIRRYGGSKGGVFIGSKYVCRVDQGEIWAHNVIRHEIAHNAEMITPSNPRGKFGWERLMRRGRLGVARMLYTKKLVSYSDLARLS